MFIFLGISLVYADTGADAPVLQQGPYIDQNTFDFGKVKEGDVVKHTFILKNTSQAPFNITQVNTSCACASSDLTVKRLEPGQQVPVELAFDTKGYPGMRKRQLFVHTDAPKNSLVIFEVQAEVVPR